MSTEAWRQGRQAEASCTSALSSDFRDTQSRPVLALRRADEQFEGTVPAQPFDTDTSHQRPRTPLSAIGLRCAGENCVAKLASMRPAGDRLTSSPGRWPSKAAGIIRQMADQEAASACRAPARPPRAQSSAMATAFIASALLPLKPSNSKPMLSSRASSCPQRARLAPSRLRPCSRPTRRWSFRQPCAVVSWSGSCAPWP